MEGRGCFISKRKDGSVDHVNAPNNKRSKLFDDAFALLGNKDKALNVWATVYSDEFATKFGNWMRYPTEFRLDENGEPLLDDVISFIRKETYKVGDFTREEARELSSSFRSMGVGGFSGLYDVISTNFLIDGDILLNEHNMRSSGVYTEEEIQRLLSNEDLMDAAVCMMRRVIAYGSTESSTMSGRDAYFLEPSDYEDSGIYGNEYDALGKRKAVNLYEVEATIKDVVGGIKDRAEFDRAFESVPYESIVDRYLSDPDYADSMFDYYSKFTRAEVVDMDGQPVSDSIGSATEEYLGGTEDEIAEARDALSSIIDMTDEDINDLGKVRESLSNAAVALADVGIDISDVIESPSALGEPVRELAASIDAVLSDMSSRRGEVDITDMVAAIDAMTGKGTPRTSVVEMGDQENIVVSRSGMRTPSDMYEAGFLQVGRGVYRRVEPIEDVEAVYSAMADVVMAYPEALPTVNIGDVSGLSKEEVVERLRRKVLSYSSSLNTERMVLTRMAMGLPIDVRYESVDEVRELNRYREGSRRKVDLYKGITEFRKEWIKEKIKNSDLYRNVLRFISFEKGMTLRLNRTDGLTARDIELSLPDGKIRDFLMDYAMTTADASFSSLFYLDSDYSGIADNRFQRELRRRNPALTRQVGGPVKMNEDGTMELDGTYDNYMANGAALYEKVGETRYGSVYGYIGPMIFADPANVMESAESNVKLSFRGDRNSITETFPASSVTLERNEYTSENDRLMKELTCEG